MPYSSIQGHTYIPLLLHIFLHTHTSVPTVAEKPNPWRWRTMSTPHPCTGYIGDLNQARVGHAGMPNLTPISLCDPTTNVASTPWLLQSHQLPTGLVHGCCVLKDLPVPNAT